MGEFSRSITLCMISRAKYSISLYERALYLDGKSPRTPAESIELERLIDLIISP